ncbi:MAG: cyanophycin synthetase [Gemmatimonadales bacterium]|jgi:cyanophycin synthetase
MKLLDRSVYLGPNVYARFPVIRLRMDIGDLEDWPSMRLGRGFVDDLLEALPGLREHGCSYGEPGGFVRRLTEDEGTWAGHILEHLAIELQASTGEDITFGKTRHAGEPGVYDIVYEYEAERVGIEAGRLAIQLFQSLLPEELRTPGLLSSDFDFQAEYEEFIRFAHRTAFGPSTASLVKAAEERDIPWLRLNEYSLVQMGHGKYQQRIQATVTSKTPHIAVEISSDKEETNRILGDLGLPVPQQRLVYSSSEAVRSAERIGFPVVVKPFNANHGRGVSLNLTDSEHVRIAFERAREISRGVIVEKFITGFDHRILVVNGEVVAAAKRVPGHVVGDGEQTIEQLVAEVNRDPRRGIGHEKILTRIELDYQAERLLELLGYTKDTVPPEGETVYLRSTGNLSTGGTAVDVTDVMHPDNREMAVRAAAAIGLDVAGVDFLTGDISQSHKEFGGAICEVNAAPGFRMHAYPSEGQPRDVAGAVMDMLFPPGSPSRVPIYAVTGTNGKTTTVRMLAHIHKLAGARVGLATTDGVYVDGQLTVPGDMTGPSSARIVLRDPAVDVAVLETARGGILRAGLGFRRANVSACLNVAADHLGLRDVNTLDELAEVKRVVIDAASDTVVLNADDPRVLRMADYAEAEHVCYVTMSPHHGLVREHIRAGGRAIVLEEGIAGHMITIYDNGHHIPLLWSHLIPATVQGKALHNVQNAMFAAAMAFSGGVKLEDIRHGLRTFDSTFFQAPGRLNFYDQLPFRVLLDYAHNAHAMEKVCEVVKLLDVPGRRIAVLSAPGDRRDEDIAAMARATVGAFDAYICRRDDSLRGRRPDEVPEILSRALVEAGVPEDAVRRVPDEVEAVDSALRTAESGDLLVVFADALERTWNQIVDFSPNGGSADGSPAAEEGPDDATAHAAATPPAATSLAPPVEPAPGAGLPDLPEFELEADERLIRDERGVRLARDYEDD